MITDDGTREVTTMRLNGKPVLLVTDPRSSHGKVALGFIPVKTVTVKRRRMKTIDGVRKRYTVKVEILSDETIAALKECGVTLRELQEKKGKHDEGFSCGQHTADRKRA